MSHPYPYPPGQYAPRKPKPRATRSVLSRAYADRIAELLEHMTGNPCRVIETSRGYFQIQRRDAGNRIVRG